MAFNLFRRKTGGGKIKYEQIACADFFNAAVEYQIRELAFWSCVNRIANAIGRCDFRTYVNGKEVRDREHYLWNIDPNPLQNSTAFLHKFIARLAQDNEALIVPLKRQGGGDALYVADSWGEPYDDPQRAATYDDITIGNLSLPSLPSSEVIHIRWSWKNMRAVIDGLYQSYYKLVDTAIKAYGWQNGQHWKVHVDQITSGGEGWEESFQKMLMTQIKPFFDNPSAILPEFDGYSYSNVGADSKYADASTTRDIRALVDDIFLFTARGFGIPDVLITGSVADSKDALSRFLTDCIDPLADQLGEEITRKRYGFKAWSQGSYLRVDTSAIQHFELFGAAADIEKLVGSAAFTINDIRRAAGEELIDEPWANTHYLTKNIGDFDSLADQKGENNG